MGCGASKANQPEKPEGATPRDVGEEVVKTTAATSPEAFTPPPFEGSVPADAQIFFVLGGPGSGKSTQCDHIKEEYQCVHLSAGNLLRAEAKSGSAVGQKCEELMREGKLVPFAVMLNLLKKAMIESGGKFFLIDGFPRAMDQTEQFEKSIMPCNGVLFFDCPEEEMEKRLLKRGKTSGRSDDNAETIHKRFRTFLEQSLPVKDHYLAQGKCHVISAIPPPKEVYTNVKAVLDSLSAPKKQLEFALPPVEGSLPEDAQIVFVLGGPGSGKGTQCDKIKLEYECVHLSAGDLLRAEVKSGSAVGQKCEELMREGKLVPFAVTLNLLKKAMIESSGKFFLIDGFPRALDQAEQFEGSIMPCKAVLFFDCTEEEMEKRLLKRGETSGCSDDNAETIRKRFWTFLEQSLPVKDHYLAQGKCHVISAVPPPKEVYEEVKAVLGGINAPQKPQKDDLDKALHKASEMGDVEAVRQLLETGADAGASDKYGYTPLHKAIEHGHLDVVQLLLEAGADAGASDKFGYTPLYMASKDGHLDVVKLLLEAGADARASTESGYIPLHMASKDGRLDVVKLLLEAGADVGASDKYGYTPLHMASKDGHLDVVRLLLEAGSDVGASNELGSTPLHKAIEHGHLDVVQVLLEAGADVGASDKDGETPLHNASWGGHLDVVRLLLEAGADVGASNESGYTPLHMASKDGHLDVVRLLLEAGADVGASNELGSTPLHKAVEHGHLDVVQVLLEAGADARASTEDGETPLHKASQRGHLDVVKLLLEAGAEAGALDEDGETLLHKASQRGHLDVMKLLLEKESDACASNKIGALVTAIREGNWEIARLLLESIEDDDMCGTTQCQGTEHIRELHSLPDQELVRSLHYNMEDKLKSANMRLLCIDAVLQWDHLPVFEHVPVEVYWAKPYYDTDDEIWSKTAVLSWRWTNNKPQVQGLSPAQVQELLSRFSPMSIEQLQELKSMLRSAKAAAGLEYVWIDWCCAPQYSEDKAATMVEVLRSKVYYMRAQQLLVLPAYDRLPKDHHVVMALQGIQQMLLPQNLGHSTAVSLLLSAVNQLLGHPQESHMCIANHEYYHRIWTLAERMARHGSSERLCNFMPLHTWVGMVLRVVDSWKPTGGSSVCFQDSLGEDDVWKEASGELHKQTKDGATTYQHLLALLLKAVFPWHQTPASIPGMNAAPTQEWLQSYLADVHSGVYQAWDRADKVWGIYSYYSGVVRGRSLTDLLGALRELVELATGRPPVCLSQLHVDTTSDEQATATQIQKLLDLVAVDMKAAKNKTDALRFAVELGCSEAIGPLKSAGEDVNARSADGETPLLEACARGHLDVVRLLLEAGADARSSNKDGVTPLHMASQRGHLDVVKLLLEAGADVGALDDQYEPALHMASKGGHLDVVKLLLEAGADAGALDDDRYTDEAKLLRWWW